jgi:hypothetical protein
MAKTHSTGLAGELDAIARRVAAVEKLASDEAAKSAKVGVMLTIAADALRVLAAGVERKGGYAKGSPMDKAVKSASAILANL